MLNNSYLVWEFYNGAWVIVGGWRSKINAETLQQFIEYREGIVSVITRNIVRPNLP